MRTKIIATLGPASQNYEVMKEMVKYGVRIFRLNFSHSDAAHFIPSIKIIRELENEFSIPLTAMGDLSGPKVRIEEVPGAPIQINKGEKVFLGLPDTQASIGDAHFMGLAMPEILKDLQKDMPVSISDGALQFTVTNVVTKDRLFELTALNAGFLSSHKGIAFPGKTHKLPALTAKDRKDLHEGLEVGIDAIAVSFVQTKQDVVDVKTEIVKHGKDVWVPVVAKIERQNAVDNIEAILTVADAVMVARGDLGLECPLSNVPIIQKKIIRACRHAQKPAIVATQMLLSMVKNPMPTRAESTDVANAVMDGADCVMLSDETTVGNYPVETVKFMAEIACNAEDYYLERLQGPYAPKKERNPAKYLAYAACLLADNSDSEAIVCHSTSGATARLVSSRRPMHMIYALSSDIRVIRALNFTFAVQPRLVTTNIPGHMDRAQDFVQNSDEFTRGRNVVITAGQPTPGQLERYTNEIKLYHK